MINLHKPRRKNPMVPHQQNSPQNTYHIRMEELRTALRFQRLDFDGDTAVGEADAERGNGPIAAVLHNKEEHGKGFGYADVDVVVGERVDRGGRGD